MPITTFIDPARLPNRAQAKADFDKAMAEYYRLLPQHGNELNALVTEIDLLMAGGVYAFPYVFDSSTTDADPGVGKLRLGSVAQNTATVMRMDLQVVGGVDISNVFADLRAATSSIKGSIRLVKTRDPSKWMIFDVTAMAIPTGYRNLTVSARAASANNPFANGDELIVYFQRNGDSGTVPGATELLAEMVVLPTSPVNKIAFPNVFDAAHDWYLVDIENLELSESQGVFFEFHSGGVASNLALYSMYNAPVSVSSFSNSVNLLDALGVRVGGLLQLRGVNSNSINKSIIFDGNSVAPLGGGGTECRAIARRGAYNANVVVSGFGLRPGYGNFTSALVRVYGVRKQ